MDKKIVFFVPTLEIGGAERNTINIISALSREKCKIQLLLCKKKGDFLLKVPAGIDVFEIKSLNSFLVFLRLIKFFRKEKPDLFVSNLLRFNLLSSLSKMFSGVNSKIVLIEHTQISFLRKGLINFLLPALMRFAYKGADLIIAVSQKTSDDLRKILKNKKEIKVIYNPVFDKKIADLSVKPVSHVWLENKRAPVIIAVGRLVKAKNYPFLLKALKLVLEKKSVKFIILGEGPEKENLKKIAKDEGIFESVDFMGNKENPYKYMAKADVFVNCSEREGFGNAIVEAMACGTPVIIAGHKAEPSEIITNNFDGLLVSLENEKGLASAILEILGNKPFSEELSRNGKEKASFFSVEKSVNNYKGVFNQLFNDRFF